MCGAACAGLGQAAGERRAQALMAFQLGRLGGYALLGAVAAASVQGLGWLTTQSAAIRPVWTLLHLSALVLGLLLMLQARQPVWLDAAARRLWARVRALNTRWGRAAPWMVGGLWAFMPCGLLYSALMVAALTSQPLEGAVTMALFDGEAEYDRTNAHPQLTAAPVNGSEVTVDDGCWSVLMGAAAHRSIDERRIVDLREYP
jgi:sulfite exporter TauE/SafE